MSLMRSKIPSLARGATLIEVMIALLVLAVGLLGFAAMQTEGLVSGRKAFLSSQAQLLAEDMAERIRANSPNLTGVASYAMSISDRGADNSCNTNNCTTADILKWDQYRWKIRLGAELPSGNGDISVSIGSNPYATVKIRVIYSVDRDSSSAEKTANQSEYVLSTQINPT